MVLYKHIFSVCHLLYKHHACMAETQRTFTVHEQLKKKKKKEEKWVLFLIPGNFHFEALFWVRGKNLDRE